ncbi:7038_t:CDS:2, partial [Cetraspora pellucida]
CVVENSKQCITVAYASTIDNENPNREFDFTSVPICIPHCMFSVLVNHNPKITEKFIHFGVKSVEYNSITGSSNVKMKIIVFYSSQFTRFKHLGHLGSNIKVGNAYLVSGPFKFSDSGKIVIEATDIDYSKPLLLNFNNPKIPSSTSSNTRTIIDIIVDDVDSTLPSLNVADVEVNLSLGQKNCIELDAKDNNSEPNFEYEPDEHENSSDRNDD